MLKTKFLMLSAAFVCCLTPLLVAQDFVDVYFIAGQSNAGNFGEINSNDVQGYNGYNAADFSNQSDVGFNLTFGRIRDRRSGGPVNEVVEAFSSNLLDPANYAVDNFAVQVNQEFGNDIGIFSYGRNGRALENADDTVDGINGQRNDSGESWDPNVSGELYDAFIDWSSDRLAEIESTGAQARVQGILWFHGEEDARNNTDDTYQANFEDLISGFREEFNNPELAIVASEIREVGADRINAENVNDALNSVALNDAFVEVIDISDTSIYIPESANDVHLDEFGQIALSNDFASRVISLNAGTSSVPEPSSLAVLGLAAISLVTRRRR